MTVVDDLVAVALAAAATPATEELGPAVLTDLAAAVGADDGSCRAIDAAITGSSPAARAYRLATRMHARTQDDFYPFGRVHVGTTTIPVALIVGAPRPIEAIAAGYQVTKVLAHAYSMAAQQTGYRPTSLFAPMGAAATAAVGLGLSREALASALAIASAMCGGTNQSWIDGTDEWLLEVGAATRTGVEAAQLAAAGATGAPRAIDGDAGWANAFFGDPDASRLRALLADAAAVAAMGRVATKPYPVSGIAQAPTAAAAALHAQLGGRPVNHMVVRMAPIVLAYPGSRNSGPFRSRSDSLMSVSRCCALAYVHGAIPLASLSGAPGPAESEVLARLELVGDEDLDEGEAVVRVTTDGAEAHEVRQCTEDLLFPSFKDLLGDLDGLARRSEADPRRVHELALAFSEEEPSAEELARLLEAPS